MCCIPDLFTHVSAGYTIARRESPAASGTASARLASTDKKVPPLLVTLPRIALAAVGVFAYYGLEVGLAYAVTIGVLVSIPAALIAAGVGLIYYAVATAIGLVASFSFANLGLSLTALAAGWLALHIYDVPACGLVEQCIFDNI